MTGTAIQVENLSKLFKLYPSQGKRFLDYLTLGKGKYYNEFWALRDISFSVPQGSTFGILGQNGSGKSTLLSILAGILEITEGKYFTNGKVSAILELGAGFHPEFTGRANTYMYGSIMGLTKNEIEIQIPKIIEFSELGDFFDLPLRTYSSGMYARLAFSVAVNVDADILIIDEALAVGDVLFQHRCFRKIHELKNAGKTILYVGHDTEAVRSLCDHAMILDGGRMINIGDSAKVTNEYLALIAEREQKYYETNLQEYGKKPDQNYKVFYNFIEHLVDAEKKVINPEYIREQTIEVRNTPRRTIFAHPPSEIWYRVFIDEDIILAFAIGIYPSAYDFIQEGIRFSILLNNEEIFSKSLDVKNNTSDRGWFNHMINLSEYCGKEVVLQFKTECMGQDISYCWAGWGWPQLFTYKENKSLINHSNSHLHVQIGNKKAEIQNIEILDEHNDFKLVFNSGEIVIFRTHILVHEDLDEKFGIGWVIRNRLMEVAGTNTYEEKIKIGPCKAGDSIIAEYQVILNLTQGAYFLQTGCFLIYDSKYSHVEVLDRHYDKIMFEVILKNKYQPGVVNLNGKVSINRSKNVLHKSNDISER